MLVGISSNHHHSLKFTVQVPDATLIWVPVDVIVHEGGIVSRYLAMFSQEQRGIKIPLWNMN